MYRNGLLILAITFGGVLGMAEPADAQILRFEAICTPDQEVPPVEGSTARSVANLKVINFPSGPVLITTRIDRRLSTPYTVSHIHLAPEGVTGPPVILYDPPRLEIIGVLAISADIHTSEDLIGPLAGMTLDDLVEEIEAGNTYVNVHTEQNPSGETRGQIESRTRGRSPHAN
jgi:hypothetical protein